MTPPAIVLAGGLGTRLRDAEPELPKAMVEVGGRPFLEHQLDYLAGQGVTRVVLSVGFRHEAIQAHFQDRYRSVDITYCIEASPLGTGGAILKSLGYLDAEPVLVLNGDTYFPIDLAVLTARYRDQSADVAVALKHMGDTSRYGQVVPDDAGRIAGFREKSRESGPGMINGGVYVTSASYLRSLGLPEKCSFENDVLGAFYEGHTFVCPAFDAYFIDIGVPQDLAEARRVLGNRPS